MIEAERPRRSGQTAGSGNGYKDPWNVPVKGSHHATKRKLILFYKADIQATRPSADAH
jgi:hypothetical protein